MSSYTSRFIIPGKRAGNIKQIINNEVKCDTITTNIPQPQPFIITSGNSDIQYIDDYYYITFTNNSTIHFLKNIDNVTCVLVGGGGAGAGGNSGGNSGGGGGGGGGVSINNISLQVTDYTIVVGQGGSGTSNKSGTGGGFTHIFNDLGFTESVKGGGGGDVGTGDSGSNPGGGGIAGPGGGNGGIGYKPGSNGSNGYTVPNLGLVASGGSGGPPNDPGNPGDMNGGGKYIFNLNSKGSQTGISASFYGCGGGASSGEGRFQFSGPSGGNGASGVVFIYFKYSKFRIIENCHTCKCPQEINTKVVKSSNPDVDPTLTQNQRAVNAIRYSVGGRVIFGNNGSGVTFLGRTEGQPGGIKFPPKNKF